MKMKKRLLAGMILFALTLTMALPASAAGIAPTDESAGYLIISDPSTGEKWSWELPPSDVSTACISTCDDTSEAIQTTEVTVNLGEYLFQTMPATDIEQTQYDDITLTAGFSYSYNSQTKKVAMYRAYGSAPSNGLYYTTKQEFYYQNPGVFERIYQYPTTSSWSYTTNSAWGIYAFARPTASGLNCRITVAGMEYTYRDVEVYCPLSINA